MKRATLKQRLFAILIDYFIFAVIILLISIVAKQVLHSMSNTILIVLIFNIIFIAKDTTGQSPGKKIMGIKIVRKFDSGNPGIILPFIRNLFLCLGVIEIVVIMLNKNQERIGDNATGTIVIQKNTQI